MEPDDPPDSGQMSETIPFARRRSLFRREFWKFACGLLIVGVLWYLIRGPQAQPLDLDRSAWLRVKVLPKAGAVVKSGDKVLDTSNWSLPFTVQGVEGQRLLVGKKKKGWVLRSDVVTLDEAQPYYTHLLQDHDQRARAYHMRAVLWQLKGESERSIEDYGQAIRIQPREAVTYCNRGTAWAAKQEYDKALADYDRAVQLNPKDGPAYANRGAVWVTKQEYDKALDDFDRALWLDAEDGFAYCGRGRVWLAKKEYHKAIADYDQVLQRDPQDDLAYIGRSAVWLATREYDKVLADCDHALRLNPEQAYAFNDLAWLRATCPDAKYRDGPLAVKNAIQACELTKWKDANTVGTLGAACAEAGDFESAMEWQRQAILLDPNDGAFVVDALHRLDLYAEKQPYRDEERHHEQ